MATMEVAAKDCDSGGEAEGSSSAQSSPGQLNGSVDSGIIIDANSADPLAAKLRQRLQQCQRILEVLHRDRGAYQQLRDRLGKIVDKKAKKGEAAANEGSCNVCCAELDISNAKSYVTCCTCGKFVCRSIKCADWLPSNAKWECDLCHSSKESLAQTSSWVAEQISFNQQKCVYPLRAKSEIYIPISNDCNESNIHFESVSQVGLSIMNSDERSKIREYVEEIVAEMLGGSLEQIKVGQLSSSENYLQLFDKYHAKLSNLLINVENAALCAISHRGDLPAIVNASNNNISNNNNNNNNNEQNGSSELADISQLRLRNLIETIIAETLRSSALNGNLSAVSEISLDTKSNGNGIESVPRRHRTEHYFEPKIYQDLLATAVLNKIADKEGNNTRLISESAPDISAHNIDENYNAEVLSTTSGSSIEPRSESSLTDNELLINPGKSESHISLQVALENESLLSDYIAAHMVPLPDLSASVTESEDDIGSITSSMLGDGTWEDNWMFKKKRSSLQSSATPSSIGMLVPAPKENIRAQIGDRTADEISDLSELGSDNDESSLDLMRCNELNERLLSKHLIGGQNTKLVLDELVDRASLTSNTLPAENEPAFTETSNELVLQPIEVEAFLAPPPPMIFQDEMEDEEENIQGPIAAIDQIESDEQLYIEMEGCTGFGTVDEFIDGENTPSVIEILAAMALGPMLAVPASEQPGDITPSELQTLKELKDLALAEIHSRTMDITQHSLDVIEEENTEAQLTITEEDFATIVPELDIATEDPLISMAEDLAPNEVVAEPQITIKEQPTSVNISTSEIVAEPEILSPPAATVDNAAPPETVADPQGEPSEENIPIIEGLMAETGEVPPEEVFAEPQIAIVVPPPIFSEEVASEEQVAEPKIAATELPIVEAADVAPMETAPEIIAQTTVAEIIVPAEIIAEPEIQATEPRAPVAEAVALTEIAAEPLIVAAEQPNAVVEESTTQITTTEPAAPSAPIETDPEIAAIEPQTTEAETIVPAEIIPESEIPATEQPKALIEKAAVAEIVPAPLIEATEPPISIAGDIAPAESVPEPQIAPTELPIVGDENVAPINLEPEIAAIVPSIDPSERIVPEPEISETEAPTIVADNVAPKETNPDPEIAATEIVAEEVASAEIVQEQQIAETDPPIDPPADIVPEPEIAAIEPPTTMAGDIAPVEIIAATESTTALAETVAPKETNTEPEITATEIVAETQIAATELPTVAAEDVAAVNPETEIATTETTDEVKELTSVEIVSEPLIAATESTITVAENVAPIETIPEPEIEATEISTAEVVVPAKIIAEPEIAVAEAPIPKDAAPVEIVTEPQIAETEPSIVSPPEIVQEPEIATTENQTAETGKATETVSEPETLTSEPPTDVAENVAIEEIISELLIAETEQPSALAAEATSTETVAKPLVAATELPTSVVEEAVPTETIPEQGATTEPPATVAENIVPAEIIAEIAATEIVEDQQLTETEPSIVPPAQIVLESDIGEIEPPAPMAEEVAPAEIIAEPQEATAEQPTTVATDVAVAEIVPEPLVEATEPPAPMAADIAPAENVPEPQIAATELPTVEEATTVETQIATTEPAAPSAPIETAPEIAAIEPQTTEAEIIVPAEIIAEPEISATEQPKALIEKAAVAEIVPAPLIESKEPPAPMAGDMEKAKSVPEPQIAATELPIVADENVVPLDLEPEITATVPSIDPSDGIVPKPEISETVSPTSVAESVAHTETVTGPLVAVPESSIDPHAEVVQEPEIAATEASTEDVAPAEIIAESQIAVTEPAAPVAETVAPTETIPEPEIEATETPTEIITEPQIAGTELPIVAAEEVAPVDPEPDIATTATTEEVKELPSAEIVAEPLIAESKQTTAVTEEAASTDTTVSEPLVAEAEKTEASVEKAAPAESITEPQIESTEPTAAIAAIETISEPEVTATETPIEIIAESLIAAVETPTAETVPDPEIAATESPSAVAEEIESEESVVEPVVAVTEPAAPVAESVASSETVPEPEITATNLPIVAVEDVAPVDSEPTIAEAEVPAPAAEEFTSAEIVAEPQIAETETSIVPPTEIVHEPEIASTEPQSATVKDVVPAETVAKPLSTAAESPTVVAETVVLKDTIPEPEIAATDIVAEPQIAITELPIVAAEELALVDPEPDITATETTAEVKELATADIVAEPQIVAIEPTAPVGENVADIETISEPGISLTETPTEIVAEPLIAAIESPIPETVPEPEIAATELPSAVPENVTPTEGILESEIVETDLPIVAAEDVAPSDSTPVIAETEATAPVAEDVASADAIAEPQTAESKSSIVPPAEIVYESEIATIEAQAPMGEDVLPADAVAESLSTAAESTTTVAETVLLKEMIIEPDKAATEIVAEPEITGTELPIVAAEEMAPVDPEPDIATTETTAEVKELASAEIVAEPQITEIKEATSIDTVAEPLIAATETSTAIAETIETIPASGSSTTVTEEALPAVAELEIEPQTEIVAKPIIAAPVAENVAVEEIVTESEIAATDSTTVVAETVAHIETVPESEIVETESPSVVPEPEIAATEPLTVVAENIAEIIIEQEIAATESQIEILAESLEAAPAEIIAEPVIKATVVAENVAETLQEPELSIMEPPAGDSGNVAPQEIVPEPEIPATEISSEDVALAGSVPEAQILPIEAEARPSATSTIISSTEVDLKPPVEAVEPPIAVSEEEPEKSSEIEENICKRELGSDLIEATQSDDSALGKMTQKSLRRHPNIPDTTPSDGDANAKLKPVNLFGTICKFYIKDKRLLATIERRRRRTLIMYKYLSSFDSDDEPPPIDDSQYEPHPSLYEELKLDQNNVESLNTESHAEVAAQVNADNIKPTISESHSNPNIEDSSLTISDIATLTAADIDIFTVGTLRDISFNFINNILFSDQLSSKSNNADDSPSTITCETSFNGDSEREYDSESVEDEPMTCTYINPNNNSTNITITKRKRSNGKLTNGSLKWSNKGLTLNLNGGQHVVDVDVDDKIQNQNDDVVDDVDIDDVVLLRRFVPGSIAEREVKKWYNAVDMPNNPYAPEALKQRISGHQERCMDLPNISPSVEQKALASAMTNATAQEADEAQARETDYKRYSRDYYINDAPSSATASKVPTPTTCEESPICDDVDIVINEPPNANKRAAESVEAVFTALPAQILEEGASSIETLSNQSNLSLQTATSDDSDTVRVYDFNKQEITAIREAIIESSISASASSPSPGETPKKRERPIVLQFGPNDAVPIQLDSPKTPTRGSTPPAFRFLQPKRRLIEPSQVLSIDEDDDVPEEPSTPSEKPIIEHDVAHAMPSVKALAQAFLLTSKHGQMERRWRSKVKKLPLPSPASPLARRPPLEHGVSMAEVADESTIADDLSSLETDPSIPSEGHDIASPASPVPVRRGFLRSNIAFFENLKFK